MKTIRTVAETRLLAVEAERRARAGETLAAIASSMGIPTSTISDWARLGSWRRKDLEQEKAEEIARLIAGRHIATRNVEPARFETKSAEPTAEAPSNDIATEPPVSGEDVPDQPLPEFTAITMAQILLERGHLDAADKAIRIATRFVQFRNQVAHHVFK